MHQVLRWRLAGSAAALKYRLRDPVSRLYQMVFKKLDWNKGNVRQCADFGYGATQVMQVSGIQQIVTRLVPEYRQCGLFKPVNGQICYGWQ